VFENRVLRRIFGPKRDEVTGGSRKLNNEELRNLPSIIVMIDSERMRWVRNVARMGYSFLLEAETTPGPYCGWKDQVNWKIK
jgi:hypothetical protein